MMNPLSMRNIPFLLKGYRCAWCSGFTGVTYHCWSRDTIEASVGLGMPESRIYCCKKVLGVLEAELHVILCWSRDTLLKPVQFSLSHCVPLKSYMCSGQMVCVVVGHCCAWDALLNPVRNYSTIVMFQMVTTNTDSFVRVCGGVVRRMMTLPKTTSRLRLYVATSILGCFRAVWLDSIAYCSHSATRSVICLITTGSPLFYSHSFSLAAVSLSACAPQDLKFGRSRRSLRYADLIGC